MERNKLITEPDKVWVTVSATFNLGNYENVKIDSGYSRTLKSKDDPAELREEMINELSEEVLSAGKLLKKKANHGTK